MKIENLTEAEEIVMKAVWGCKKEPALADIVEQTISVYGKDWKPQTVSTFLAKLVRKNYVKLQRNGKIYTYKVLISEKAYKQKLYRHHISFWNHNNIKEFVQEMLTNGDLTRENLEQIKTGGSQNDI